MSSLPQETQGTENEGGKIMEEFVNSLIHAIDSNLTTLKEATVLFKLFMKQQLEDCHCECHEIVEHNHGMN